MKKIVLVMIISQMVLLLFSCSDPKDININAEAPYEVNVGDTFQIVCTAENVANRDQTLVSLDIADEYLAGIAVVSTNPGYTDYMHVPLDNTESYTVDIVIPPGETVTVIIEAKALVAGMYRGDIDFCINSEYNFLSDPVQTLVSVGGSGGGGKK